MGDADSGSDGSSSSLGMLFLRRTAAILGIYAVGYLELSPAWLVGGIILSVMREKWSRQKKTKRALARAIALNSEQVTLAKLQDLPSWVRMGRRGEGGAVGWGSGGCDLGIWEWWGLWAIR